MYFGFKSAPTSGKMAADETSGPSMALLIDIKQPQWMRDEELRAQLLRRYPEADIRIAAEPGAPDEIEMLTVSTYHPGEALRYPNLRVIQKTGAGVNNILADETLPPSIEVVRLQTRTSGEEMAEYALACVLQEQRHLRAYREQQARAEWLHYPPRIAAETTVAVLGLGRVGGRVAKRFVANDFSVVGWSRGPKEIAGVDCFVGDDGLGEVLARADYVVAVLPSTPATRGLFDYACFGRFRDHAWFVNLGRGDQVVEPDLLRALDDGRIAGAVLDVMSTEPLPPEDPLWRHPKVQLTPHVSGYHLGDAIDDIAENYRRLRAGEPLLHRVDRERGY